MWITLKTFFHCHNCAILVLFARSWSLTNSRAEWGWWTETYLWSPGCLSGASPPAVALLKLQGNDRKIRCKKKKRQKYFYIFSIFQLGVTPVIQTYLGWWRRGVKWTKHRLWNRGVDAGWLSVSPPWPPADAPLQPQKHTNWINVPLFQPPVFKPSRRPVVSSNGFKKGVSSLVSVCVKSIFWALHNDVIRLCPYHSDQWTLSSPEARRA